MLQFFFHPQLVVGKYFLKHSRHNCKFDLINQQEIKIEEYLNTLDQSVIYMQLLNNKFVGIIHFEENLIFYLVDRMMGGTRTPFIKKYSDSLTKVDLKNLKILNDEMSSIIGDLLFQSPMESKFCQLPFDQMNIPQHLNLTIAEFKVESTEGFGGNFTFAIHTNLIS